MSVPARFAALDAFRGAAVALMILVNNPGTWAHMYPPLAHAPWHGVTPTDLVFPFFLFAVGNALAFVMPGYAAAPAAAFWRKVVQRTALIFLIGLLLNWSPFVRWDAAGELALRPWETLRTMGVLQRIALSWGLAAVIVWWAGARGAAWLCAALLLGYWAAFHLFATGADPYSIEGFFGTHVDRALLGAAHMYKGEGVAFDPEGLASTAGAIAQVLLGYFAGHAVVAAGRAGQVNEALVVRLFVAASVMLAVAYLWQLGMPLNKKLWTSSYVLHTTGLALMGLALLIHAIELRGWRGGRNGWFDFLDVFGKNALFIFVLSGFVPRVLALFRWSDGVDAEGRPRWLTPLPWVYRTVFEPIGAAVDDLRLGSFLFSLANLSVYWAIARAMDRRRIYVKV